MRQLRRDDGCLLDAFEIPHGNLNRRILELEIFGSLNGKNSIVIARALPLSLPKTPNRSENLEIFATSPYRRGHDHDFLSTLVSLLSFRVRSRASWN